MPDNEYYSRIIETLKHTAAMILPKGSQVALYGSRARGDALLNSDWDIQILIPGDEKLPLSMWDHYAWPFADAGLDLGEIVNPRLYSFAGWFKRSFLPFHQNVEREKVIIFQN